MFKKMKHMKNEKGLTLIELLAVIVILAIIAAIAIPAIGNIINNSRDKAVLSDIQNAISAAKIASADGSCGQSQTITAIVTGGATTGVVCDGTEFEFKSDRIANTSTGEENITVTIASDGEVEVATTLAKAFAGTKISGAVTAAAADANNQSKQGVIGTGNALTITESRIISVLGGN